MPNRLGPEHWVQKAEEAKALAAAMTDPVAKVAMLKIVEQYGLLAAAAARIREQEARDKSAI